MNQIFVPGVIAYDLYNLCSRPVSLSSLAKLCSDHHIRNRTVLSLRQLIVSYCIAPCDARSDSSRSRRRCSGSSLFLDSRAGAAEPETSCKACLKGTNAEETQKLEDLKSDRWSIIALCRTTISVNCLEASMSAFHVLRRSSLQQVQSPCLQARQSTRHLQRNFAARANWYKTPPPQNAVKRYLNRFSSNQVVYAIMGINIAVFGLWQYADASSRRSLAACSIYTQGSTVASDSATSNFSVGCSRISLSRTRTCE